MQKLTANPKIVWQFKGPRAAKTILKKNKAGRLELTNFKTYYKAIVIKTKTICIDIRIEIEISEIEFRVQK